VDEIHPETYQIIEFRPLPVAHSPSCFGYRLFSNNIAILFLHYRNLEPAEVRSRPEAAPAQAHICYNRRRAKDQEQKQACRPVS
jgi:hypothetical protein